MSGTLDVILLAAGKGTRLAGMAPNVPKPLVSVCGRPALDYTFALLRHHDLNNIGMNLHHLADVMTGYVGDGSAFGLNVSYSYEETLLGTAGGAAQFRSQLQGPTLIMYADVLTDINATALLVRHRERGAAVTIVLYRVPDPWTRGVVDRDADGRVTGFREKPPRDETGPDSVVNAGIYVIEPSVLDGITGFADFGFDVFPRLLAGGAFLDSVITDRYVYDFGTPEQHATAEADVRAGRIQIPGITVLPSSVI